MVAASLLQGPRHQSRKQSASNVGPVVVRGRFVCPCWGVALYCCFWMCGGPARVNGGPNVVLTAAKTVLTATSYHS